MSSSKFYQPFERQKYIDVEGPDEAIRLGYDIFQLKYDGIWSRNVIEGGFVHTYSRNDQLKNTFSCDLPKCVLIGEYMYGTEWSKKGGREGMIYVFDVESIGDVNQSEFPYHERLRKLIDMSLYFPRTPFKLAASCRLDAAGEVWQRIVNGEADYEGLVYRKLSDMFDATLARSKRDVTDDVVVLDKYEGQGRLVGTLGGLVVGKFDSTKTLTPLYKVGGGFSDALRAEIWNNWEKYYLSVIECVGKARFDSGALRHPNFSRLRPDKAATECLVNEI